MRTIRRTVVVLAAVVLPVFVGTAAASAKPLVLSTAGAGPLSQLEMTGTSSATTIAFNEEECGTPIPGVLKWRWVINQTGGTFTGTANQLGSLQCQAAGGGTVTIEPDPHPWFAKLNGAGKAMVHGQGGKMMELAQFPSGASCNYQAMKQNLLFKVEGPLHPIPLEPGDPTPMMWKLSKAISSAGCPMHMFQTASFQVTDQPMVGGPEETVLDE